MPSQVVYQTNADWHESYEAMAKNPLVKVYETQKGLLTFWFRGSQTVFMLAPTGKLQVKWSDLHEKRMLYKLVKNLLVSNSNEKLVIKPLRQQTWIEYPVAESFKLYWCDQATEFVLKKDPESGKEQPTDYIKAGKCLFKKITDAELDLLIGTLKDLRRDLRYLREPTKEEVAKRSGLEIKGLEPMLLLAGWKESALNEAEKRAEEAINIAGWICWKNKGEQNPTLQALYKQATDNASAKSIVTAQDIARDYPHLAARIKPWGFEWPDEIKDRWRLIFHSEPPVTQYWR